MKKLLLSLLLVLPLIASAYDVRIGGIYYNLKSEEKVAEVTKGDSKYYGAVNIPEKFTYEGNEYTVTSIGKSAFDLCYDLTSVNIPNTVKSIGYAAFYECKGLTEISIPNSITFIGDRAFDTCRGLTSVTISESLTTVGKETFYGCSGLTSLTIPNSVTSIESHAFSGCSSLTSLTIPNSVITIGDGAFYGCRGLTSVSIGNSVSTIGGGAFYSCYSLISVTIGNSVSNIGSGAFGECNKLEYVFCHAESVPTTDINAFENSSPLYATLYVPASILDEYKSTDPWNQFGNIKTLEGDAKKCVTPTISYANKQLTFSSDTEGVEYHYTITNSDIKSAVATSIDLAATYEISVYTTKSGYTNSDVATATLVWTDAVFTETTPEASTSAKAIAESIPVLISAKNGTIVVKSEKDGQPITVYTADGKALGAATIKDGQASISTNLQRGEITIVKVGSKSVKIKM